MRASYLPVRKADDALDGDAPRIINPLTYVGRLRYNIAKNELGNSPEEKLLQYAIEALESKAGPNDDPRGDFVQSLDSILYDYVRSLERRALTLEEIEEYYRYAFDPVINITLLAIDSGLRSSDVPALSYGQGRVYSAKHVAEDLERGIINIPSDVLEALHLTSRSSVEEIVGNSGVKAWFHESIAQTKLELLETSRLLKQTGEKQTQAVFGTLISSMVKYIDSQ